MVTCQPNERAVGRDPPLHKTAHSPAGGRVFAPVVRRAPFGALALAHRQHTLGLYARGLRIVSSGVGKLPSGDPRLLSSWLVNGFAAVGPGSSRR